MSTVEPGSKQQYIESILGVTTERCRDVGLMHVGVFENILCPKPSIAVESILDLLVDDRVEKKEKAAFLLLTILFYCDNDDAFFASTMLGTMRALTVPKESKYGLDHLSRTVSGAVGLKKEELKAVTERVGERVKALGDAETPDDMAQQLLEIIDGGDPIVVKALLIYGMATMLVGIYHLGKHATKDGE